MERRKHPALRISLATPIPVAFLGEARAQVPCTTFRLEDTRSERLALERYLDSLAGSVQPTLS